MAFTKIYEIGEDLKLLTKRLIICAAYLEENCGVHIDDRGFEHD